MNLSLEEKALILAYNAHKGQMRKYKVEPYIVHPIYVAEILREITQDEKLIAVALLHDTLEDTGLSFAEIKAFCGKEVADMVLLLTNEKIGDTREERNNNYIEKLLQAPKEIIDIKLLDISHNLQNFETMVEADKKFADIYFEEKKLFFNKLGSKANNLTCEILSTMITVINAKKLRAEKEFERRRRNSKINN